MSHINGAQKVFTTLNDKAFWYDLNYLNIPLMYVLMIHVSTSTEDYDG